MCPNISLNLVISPIMRWFPGLHKNRKHRIIFSENYANCVRTMGYGVNKSFTLSTSPPRSAIALHNAYTVLRFVMIIAQEHLFYAVTPG